MGDRPTSHQLRQIKVRGRMEDVVQKLGITNFAKTVVSVHTKRPELRWCENKTLDLFPVSSIENRLRIFLSGGGAHGWVLDLYEAALELTERPTQKAEGLPTAPAPPEPALDTGEDLIFAALIVHDWREVIRLAYLEFHK